MKKLSTVFIACIFFMHAPLQTAESKKISAATQALIDAAEIGDLDKVKTALANGADINGRAPFIKDTQETALGRAIANKKTEIVNHLLTLNPNLEIADTVFATFKGTPLAIAAYHSNKAAVDQLLNLKAKPNAIVERFSPLFFALISPQDNREIIQLLYFKGADQKRAVLGKDNILEEALPVLDVQNTAINLLGLFDIKRLLTYRFPNQGFNTFAHKMVLELRPNILQFLIDQGVRLDIPNAQGNTLLTIKPDPNLLADKQHKKINEKKWQEIQNMLKDYAAKLNIYSNPAALEALKKELSKNTPLPAPLQTLVIESEFGTLTPGQKELVRKKLHKIPVATNRIIIEYLDELITAIKSNNSKKIQATVEDIRQKELVSNIIEKAEKEFPSFFKQIEKLFADAYQKPSESLDKKD